MLTIIFEKKCLTLMGDYVKKIIVKDMIFAIKKSLGLDKYNKSYVLIEDRKQLAEEEEIDLRNLAVLFGKKTKLLYMVEKKIFINNSLNTYNKSALIDELIMQVTGAKDKLKLFKPIKRKLITIENSNFQPETIYNLVEGETVQRLESIRNIIRGRHISHRLHQPPNVNISPENDTQSNQLTNPDPNFLQILKDMGFDEYRIKRVLIATGNDITAASEMLLNETDIALTDYLPSNNDVYFTSDNNEVVNGEDFNYTYLNENENESEEEIIDVDDSYFVNNGNQNDNSETDNQS